MRLVQFWTELPPGPWSGGFRSPVGSPGLSGVLAKQDSRGFFVLASPSVEVTPPPIPEGIRLQESFSAKADTLQDFGPHGPTGFYPHS